MKRQPTTLVCAALLAGTTVSAAERATFDPDLAAVVAGKDVVVLGRALTGIVKDGRTAIALDGRPGDGVVLWPELEFSDGVIEFDARGRSRAPSFVGVAFHGSGQAYEAVYFRPFNFRSPDSVTRSHAVQYISNPTHGWDRLRSEHPGQYEKAVAPAPEPEAWFHARVVVAYPKISVFVNGASEPSLVVEGLSNRATGWLGLWVGNESDGSFANVSVSPVRHQRTYFPPDSPVIPDSDPGITTRLRALIQDAMDAKMHADDYTPDLWSRLSPVRREIQADLQRQGGLVSLALIDRRVEGGRRSYRYLLRFAKARAVEHFVLDEKDKVAILESEASAPEPGAAVQ
jgi:hypothetical protein